MTFCTTTLESRLIRDEMSGNSEVLIKVRGTKGELISETLNLRFFQQKTIFFVEVLWKLDVSRLWGLIL